MTAKAKASARKPRKSAEPTYSDMFATCIRQSRMIASLGKTITKFASRNDDVLDVWSYEGEPHSVALGERALLRAKHMPDGKVFYNLQ